MKCLPKPTIVVGLLAALALALASASQASERREKYEIRAAAVTPESLRIPEGATSIEATLQVRAKIIGTYTGTARACEAAIDFGDGSPVEKVVIGGSGGTSNITDIPHTFSRTGRFQITVAGSRAYNSCDGRVSADVVVLGANEQARSSSRRASTRRDRNRLSANDVELLDDITLETGRNPCPPGWGIVPGSQSAAYRFSCRRLPVAPLVCQGGTSSFESGDTIGCR